MRLQLKITPKTNARYWTAISIASMCGTNFGDFFLDVLKVSTGVAVLILATVFILLFAIDRASRRETEAIYWLTILVVRAAATQIADFFVFKVHLGYMVVLAALALLLLVFAAVNTRLSLRTSAGELPPTSLWYWMTMLTAGSLGTVIGDGVGHSLGPVSTGVPLSAAVSTVVLTAVLGARARFALISAASYWLAIVAVRWWGTNTGDILAFFLSLKVSLILTGAVLALVVVLWKRIQI